MTELTQLLDQAHVELILDALSRGHTISFVVTGSSMWPSVVSGSQVSITPIRLEKLKRGDIVLIDLGKAHVDSGNSLSDENSTKQMAYHHLWVLHRLIWLDPHRGMICTRGDRTHLPDISVNKEAILGVLTKVDLPEEKRDAISWLTRLTAYEPRGLFTRLLGYFLNLTYSWYALMRRLG